MRERGILLTTLLVGVFASLAQAGEKEDIEALVLEYSRLEAAGERQAPLMTAACIQISRDGQRRMKGQQAAIESARKPASEEMARHRGFRREVRDLEVRDLIVRLYGTAAVASFSWSWYFTFILPDSGSSVREIPLPPDRKIALPSPTTVTLVLVKQEGVWKIDLTHCSPLNPPIGDQ